MGFGFTGADQLLRVDYLPPKTSFLQHFYLILPGRVLNRTKLKENKNNFKQLFGAHKAKLE